MDMESVLLTAPMLGCFSEQLLFGASKLLSARGVTRWLSDVRVQLAALFEASTFPIHDEHPEEASWLSGASTLLNPSHVHRFRKGL